MCHVIPNPLILPYLIQVDMGELGGALYSFDDSLPYLISVKDDLTVKVSTISSESFNIDEVRA